MILRLVVFDAHANGSEQKIVVGLFIHYLPEAEAQRITNQLKRRKKENFRGLHVRVVQ